jgi:glutamate dehydrogenase/leucine dehydrogenase
MNLKSVGTGEYDFCAYTTRMEEFRIQLDDGHEFSAWHFLGFDNSSKPVVEATAVTCNLGKPPAFGGTRLIIDKKPLEEVLEEDMYLAYAMLRKNIAADLPYDGGKLCLISQGKSDRDLKWLGSIVKHMEIIFTAADAGTNQQDLIKMAETGAPFIGSLPSGSGDSSIHTARGVEMAMRGWSKWRRKTESLGDLSATILGVGNVGWALAHRLSIACDQLYLADLPEPKIQDDLKAKVAILKTASRAKIEIVPWDQAFRVNCDVLAPCCRPIGIINESNYADIGARAIIGATNNQLPPQTADKVAQLLFDTCIDYAPCYIVNAGGLIAIANEYNSYNRKAVETKIDHRLFITHDLFKDADAHNTYPWAISESDIAHVVEERKQARLAKA